MKAVEILKRLDAQPFRPFVIEISSGKRIRVSHPENVAVVPSRANISFFAVFEAAREGSREHEFEPNDVVRLSRARANGARRE